MKKALNNRGGDSLNARNSSIELLRLICLVGIVTMHINGENLKTCVGINMVWSQLENALFQTGVSIFVIISGYFQIKTTFRKLAKIEITVICYSVISTTIWYFVKGGSFLSVVKAFIPISTEKYWFMTAYVILMIVAPFFNKSIEVMEKHTFEKLLLVLICIFYVFPTVIYYHVLGDAGKGVGNFVTLYFLGAYIKKYIVTIRDNRVLIFALATSYSINVLLNIAISLISGGGARSPFARDCSVLILIESFCIFLLFLNVKMTSNFINAISKGAVSIYLFERTIRLIISEYVIDLQIFSGKWYWCFINLSLAILTSIICLIIESARRNIFANLENRVIFKLENRVVAIFNLIRKRLEIKKST